MARVGYFVVCEGVSVDQLSNNITLFNIFESCSPGQLPKAVAISSWHREEGDEDRDFQASLRIISGERRIGDFPQNFRMTAILMQA